jgi:hypothetical protein
MKYFLSVLFFILLSVSAVAQDIPTDDKIVSEIDESYNFEKDTIKLEELVISKRKIKPEDRKNFLILQNRVYATYPYAKLTSERLVSLNKGMERLKTNREKKIYFKIVEDYLTNQFEAKLKKLSRGQGKILIKLIYRQTGSSTYELIKNLKSGWKAFWSNTAASMFDLNLKTKYEPYEVNEDFLIETILNRGFNSGRLQNQPAANPVNIEDLTDHWLNKKTD